jgi:PAS domain S-box-containing protein
MDYNLYKDLIEKSPFAYNYYRIIKNEDDSIKGFECIYVNKFFETKFGTKKEEIVGKFFDKFYFAIADIKFGIEELTFFVQDSGSSFQLYKYSENFGKWFKIDLYKCDVNFISFVIFEIENNNFLYFSGEEKYKRVLDNIHEGVAVIKGDRFVYVNNMLEEITGYTESELMQMKIDNLVNIMDMSVSVDDYINEEYDTHIKPYQFRLVDRNNNVKWLEISTTDIEWEKENCVLSIINDVTKRREVEEALDKSRKRKELLIKSMNNLIFILDFDYRILEVYTSKKEMLYIEPSKFLGKKVNEIEFPKKAMELILSGLEKTEKYDEVNRIEYSIQWKEKTLWFDASFTLLKEDRFDDKKEYLCVIREITDMKESELEIRSERDLFSEGPIMTIVWDYKKNWAVKKISKNIEKLLGYHTDQFLKYEFSYMDIVFPEDREKIVSSVEYCIKNRIDSLERSYRLRNSNGKYSWFYDFTRIIRDSDGSILEIRGYLFDQSHIKEVEGQLEKKRERLKNIIKGTNAGSWEWDFAS